MGQVNQASATSTLMPLRFAELVQSQRIQSTVHLNESPGMIQSFVQTTYHLSSCALNNQSVNQSVKQEL